MNRSPRKSSGLTIQPFHDLPLFAAACHVAEEEPKLPNEPPEHVPAASGERTVDNAMVGGWHEGAVQPPQASAPSQAVPGPLDAKAIKAIIAAWGDIKPSRRANLSSSISRIDQLLGTMQAHVATAWPVDPWTCEHLNLCLWAKVPAFHGMTDRRFENVLSDLRYVLIRLGRHADAGWKRNVLSQQWANLLEALPTDDRRWRLVLFFRFLTLEDVTPETIAADALERFERWLRQQMLTDDLPGSLRLAASNWTWARREVPGWPDIDLRRPRMRDVYSAPIEEYPTSFREDVAAFLEGLRGRRRGDIFRDPAVAFRTLEGARPSRRRNHAASAGTLNTREHQIRRAAAALLHQGMAIESLTSLRDLVTPADRPRAILQFHLDRAAARAGLDLNEGEGEPTSQGVLGVAEVLRMIAVHHAQLPEEEIAGILDLVAAVRPETQGTMNEAVARKLRALNEPDVTALLLGLPNEWRERIAEQDIPPPDAARLAMYALALDILLSVPLRRQNLVNLHIDRHLTRAVGSGAITGLDIPARETKTRRIGIVWEFDTELAEQIRVYIEHFHPLLAPSDNRCLFPGLNGGPRDISDFATQLSQRVKREIGVDFNLHLVRHLTAYRILKRAPGAYELVSRVLSHATPAVTIKYYTGLELIFAMREASRLLSLDRVEARPSSTRVASARARLQRKRKAPPSPARSSEKKVRHA